MISQKELKKLFRWNPCSGLFTWNIHGSGIIYGKIAGTIGKDGYRIIMIDKKNYYAHRLAWLWVYGEWPQADIDHINTSRSDECFFNLREATRMQNMQNGTLRSNNKSGIKGVSWHRETNKWRATIKIAGTQTHLGLFISIEKAAKAYEDAALLHFGNFARPERN